MSIKNKNIRYGDVELTDDEYRGKSIKQRITMFVDQDVLLEYKKLARKSGDKYQSLINRTLRAALENRDIERRVAALEKKVGKIR